MILLALALLQQSVPPQPVPPPAMQLTADCSHPVYASDQLVCSNAELARLDGDLVRLLAENAAPSGRWIESQDMWFRRSRMCAFQADHAACLAAAYRERIGLLRAAAGAAAPTLRCSPSHHVATMQPEGLAWRDGKGALLGLAAPAAAGWQPFLELRVEPGRYRFQDQKGHLVAQCPHPGVG
jgi:hypothetical protein